MMDTDCVFYIRLFLSVALISLSLIYVPLIFVSLLSVSHESIRDTNKEQSNIRNTVHMSLISVTYGYKGHTDIKDADIRDMNMRDTDIRTQI